MQLRSSELDTSRIPAPFRLLSAPPLGDLDALRAAFDRLGRDLAAVREWLAVQSQDEKARSEKRSVVAVSLAAETTAASTTLPGVVAATSMTIAAAVSTGAATPAAVIASADGPQVTETRGLRHPDGDGQSWDDDFEQPADTRDISRGDEWGAVRWPKDDADSTEYRHLADSPLKGATFDFSADDLELLITANGFEPKRDGGRMIFALRGVELVAAPGADHDKFKQIGRTTLRLKDTRPDHQHFRCTIGVYDLASRKLTAFIASTVPCRQAVIGYINGGEGSNMLPTGCYNYVCGPHKDRQGCLREDEDFTVLRVRKTPQFDIKDNWDLNFPADNLHPAFSNKSAEFSSWGCQTVRGNHNKDDGSFSGEYNEFRNALGLKPRAGSHGTKFSYVMLTGLEAATAAELRKSVKHKDPAAVTAALTRLRHGSRGPRVEALQARLGIPTDGVFNAAVKKALVTAQVKNLGWADGIYSPPMDELLGFDVFKPTAIPVAAPVTAPPAPAPQPAPAVEPAPMAQPAPTLQPAPMPQPIAVAAAQATQPVTAAAPTAPPATPTTAPTDASPAIQATLNQMSTTTAATVAAAAPAVMASAASAVASAVGDGTSDASRAVRRAVTPPSPSKPPAVKRQMAKSKKVALVIGNGAYQYANRLGNAPKDAALVTSKLEAVGYKTIIGGVAAETGDNKASDAVRDGRDLNIQEMSVRKSEFIDAIDEGAVAVIYYAGHGVQLDGANYLVAVDADPDSPFLKSKMLPLDTLVDNARKAAGKDGKVIVLLDACREEMTLPELPSLPAAPAAAVAASGARAANAAPAASRSLASGLSPSIRHDEKTARTFIVILDACRDNPFGNAYRPQQSGLAQFDAPAGSLLAYATSPGAVAYDGGAADNNSPFAAAIGRHLTTRGLPLEELIHRVGLDVQDKVASAKKQGHVQDPWTTTNLKVPHYFKQFSWAPVIEMTLLGLLAGFFICYFAFRGGRVVDPTFEVLFWGLGLSFGAAVAYGTLRWGSGYIRDAIFALLGCGLSFAVALDMLQLMPGDGSPAALAATADATRNALAAFGFLAALVGLLLLVGTVLSWSPEHWPSPGVRWNWSDLWHGLFYILMPFVLTAILNSLQLRLATAGPIPSIIIAVIAGVLFTAGTALALKPQRSIFRGFGTLTGAITVGLVMAVFFDLYYQFSSGLAPPQVQALKLAMGTAWFGLLGAQIGYCFSFYVPERQPLKLDH